MWDGCPVRTRCEQSPGRRIWYGISKLQTDDLRLLYFDPLQTYLTPYVGRAYENSLAFQRKIFDWTPWDKPTIMLLRITADSGNAAMRATPSNAVIVEIAPMSTTFETFTPGERFFTLMNHEIFHIATLDAANAGDLWWRDVFHGKPLPIADHPESILYNYLAQPRSLVPRWYLEGSAVFMETWMGGGQGRAQGGYDEMVWRAMVRDDANFYDPLGLVAEGNAVDFQTGGNSYLYGTRFDTYLAFTYCPEKLIAWLKRGTGQQGLLRGPVPARLRQAAGPAWAGLDRVRTRLAAEEPRLGAGISAHREDRLTPRPLGSVSRAFYDAKTTASSPAFAIRASSPISACLACRRRPAPAHLSQGTRLLQADFARL